MDRATVGFTQMGGEGVPWVGQAPFTTEKHVFANLGDGTYFHTGLLAIRQSIAAGVNITYKILYNDAVAMTGGQPVDGALQRAGDDAQQLDGRGRREDRHRHRRAGEVRTACAQLAPGVDGASPRRARRASSASSARSQGTTVIIYDQTCATEKRRRRKRGTLVDPAKRVVINELVCEGCGDCSRASNCLSVEPLETEFGRKRAINQSTCNKDTRCLKGFCPSFVTVEGGQLKKHGQGASGAASDRVPPLPEPALPGLHEPCGIVVAGVGGTGVITIGQLLGMAAHLEGKGIVTQDATGLAQKGGATWSHVQIADQARTPSTRRASARPRPTS